MTTDVMRAGWHLADASSNIILLLHHCPCVSRPQTALFLKAMSKQGRLKILKLSIKQAKYDNVTTALSPSSSFLSSINLFRSYAEHWPAWKGQSRSVGSLGEWSGTTGLDWTSHKLHWLVVSTPFFFHLLCYALLAFGLIMQGVIAD